MDLTTRSTSFLDNSLLVESVNDEPFIIRSLLQQLHIDEDLLSPDDDLQSQSESDNISSIQSVGSGITNDFSNQTTSFDFGSVKKRLLIVKPKLFIQNVVSCVQINRKLDKTFILQQGIPGLYAKKKFAALIHKRPKTTALIFTTGKLVITGAKSEQESEDEAQAHINMLRTIYKDNDEGFDSFNFKIHNIVASGTTSFNVSISRLQTDYPTVCQYEPEDFPGAIFRMDTWSITLLIFASGKIVISGAKSVENVKKGFNSIVEILTSYKNTTTILKKIKK
jgi:transcription initiation factor TFIID TATA-box-binding protein